MLEASFNRLLAAPLLVRVLVALLVVRVLLTSLLFALPQLVGGRVVATDYHAFYVSGRLVWEGAIASSYDLQQFVAAMRRLVGGTEFLPWTYLPHFNLVTALLALMPLWLGNMVFGLASVGLFMLAMRCLAGPQLPLVLLAVWPALMVCLRTGQNGVLMAGLMALLVRQALAGRWQAGVPLALLTMKPQFVTGVGLWLLVRREWRIILAGGVLALALLGLATLLLAPSVWGRSWRRWAMLPPICAAGCIHCTG